MSRGRATPPGRVIRALLQAARRRAWGRRLRQAALTQHRKGKPREPLRWLSTWLMAAVMCFAHGAYGLLAMQAVETTALVEADASGRVVVNAGFLRFLEHWDPPADPILTHPPPRDVIAAARWRIRHLALPTSLTAEVSLIRDTLEAQGPTGFIDEGQVPGRKLNDASRFSSGQWMWLFGLFAWWFLMLVGQGEGLELDVQRRRYPMWEWLVSHPVRPWSALFAELFAPWMANPAYYTGLVFPLVVFGSAWGGAGLLVGVPVGLALSGAASAAAKCFEISVLVRVAPRNRGALLALSSWFGLVALVLPVLLIAQKGLLVRITRWALPLAEALPVGPLRWAFDGPGPALVAGVGAALTVLLTCVPLLTWVLRRGVTPASESKTVAAKHGTFRRHPAWRKEVLWLLRDRGAVVQAFLIPITLAGMQLFHLRGLFAHSSGSWNGLAGLAILFGSYFFLALGQRSLASEGSALWIALTWPRSLEDLLRAKARMWFALSCVIVGPVLAFAWWREPDAGPWIALTAVGWWLFGRTLAEKAVTLVSVVSPSGEVEPVPAARKWAAMAGTFSFALGILSGAWSIAVVGVVFGLLSSAAMWQDLRQRLPYLLDPWSEKEPPAPSLIQALVGIVIVTESMAVLSAIGFVVADAWGWAVRALSYGVVGLISFVIMAYFFNGKGVRLEELFRWPGERRSGQAVSFGLALGIAGALAGVAQLYMAGLRTLPATSAWMSKLEAAQASMVAAKPWIALMAVGIAPLVEEFLFRGLLYRALTRVWSARSALVGSAALFAVYHPPVAWLPVFGVGLATAWLFRHSRSLWPGIVLHAAYNALVLASG